MQVNNRAGRRVKVHWRGHVGRFLPEHPMRVCDVSEGGMSIVADASFHQGSLVTIAWVGPPRPDEAATVAVQVTLKVSYCILCSEGFRIGGALVGLPMEAAEVIWQHLTHRRAQVDLSAF